MYNFDKKDNCSIFNSLDYRRTFKVVFTSLKNFEKVYSISFRESLIFNVDREDEYKWTILRECITRNSFSFSDFPADVSQVWWLLIRWKLVSSNWNYALNHANSVRANFWSNDRSVSFIPITKIIREILIMWTKLFSDFFFFFLWNEIVKQTYYT